ncbi:MAG: hypothetical protein KDB15_15340 [Microthrixaceae bacterium]|nr:hypothetical protein [Microthrixaceae bacterium]MCB9374615.1 hypothetical protein [Microthrixaceae bacterium]MCO5305693.1 hypothetical protein [Microthrixaceae bacterium]HNM20278.1 hypothetical protein [Nitrospira sp.]HPE13969.1 hypothetical protein [Actinomycetota bacterium]
MGSDYMSAEAQGAANTSVVSLLGMVAELVPVGLVPIEPLYEIALRGGAAQSWRTRGRTVSLDAFSQAIWDASVASFAVAGRGADPPLVGYVGLYNVDEVSQVASISAFFDQRIVNVSAIAGDALRLFCTYAFDVIGLRKLTIEMPADVAGGLARVAPLVHEGTLRAQARIRGRIRDVELYALWAEEFRRSRQGLDSDALTAREVVALALGQLDVETPDDLPGGFRLLEDLGLDSIGVAELLTIIEDEIDGEVICDVGDRPLCIMDLVQAIEARSTGAFARVVEGTEGDVASRPQQTWMD